MDQEQKISVILFQKRKTIVVTIILSVIIASIATYFTPKKYASHAVVYPTKSNSLNEVATNPDFGFEIHADRLIQLMESQIIRDSLTNKFDLLEYYELEKSQPGWRHNLAQFIARDIQITRTRYLSIVVTVTTKSPELSANIANYIVSTVDVVKENILKENTRLAHQIYSEQLKSKKQDVDSLLNLVFQLSTTSNASKKNTPLFEQRKKLIQEANKNGIYADADAAILNIPIENQTQRAEQIINAYLHERGVLDGIKKKHNDTKEQLNSPVPKSYVVSKAQPDAQKVSPSLSKNIAISIGIGLLSSILLILIQHKIVEVKNANS